MFPFASFYRCTIIVAALLCVVTITAAFTCPYSTTNGNTDGKANNRKTTTLQMVSREEFLRPHFQAAASISTGTVISRQSGGFLRPRFNSATRAPAFHSSPSRDPFLDQRVQDDCDSKGGRDLEEMEQLMEKEFQKIIQKSDSSNILSFESQPQLKQAEVASPPKTNMENADMKQYLRRMHEIAEREEI